jgi:hypothetical protein
MGLFWGKSSVSWLIFIYSLITKKEKIEKL